MSKSVRQLLAATLVLSSSFGTSVSVVFAHAQYSGSTPAANSTVSAAPSVLLMTFSEEISDIKISVTAPDGSEATTAQAKFDLARRTNASVPMREAGPGLYTVVWHNVASDDGHPNDGSFVFTVAAAAPPGGGQPSAPTVPAAKPMPSCVENGVRTPGINDVRVDTYCKRQAIRDKYANQIDALTFNDALSNGEGFEAALADAQDAFQKQQAQKKS